MDSSYQVYADAQLCQVIQIKNVVSIIQHNIDANATLSRDLSLNRSKILIINKLNTEMNSEAMLKVTNLHQQL